MTDINTALPSEAAAVVATVDPDVSAAGNHDSDWVDLSLFESVMAIAMLGTAGASGTLTASLLQATASDGTGSKAITGKAASALATSDTQAVLNCRAEELDLANDFRYVALRIAIATATSDAGGVVLGFNPAHAPASDSDLASVAEIVA